MPKTPKVVVVKFKKKFISPFSGLTLPANVPIIFMAKRYDEVKGEYCDYYPTLWTSKRIFNTNFSSFLNSVEENKLEIIQIEFNDLKLINALYGDINGVI